MSGTLLRCSNVHKRFTLDKKETPELHVLKGINMEITEGEIISIVGASGSGKSTLLHILGGLDTPSEGDVFWQEINIARQSDETLARMRGEQAGFVFQFHHLLPEFTALENVMIPMMIHNTPQLEAHRRSEELLVRVGLAERRDHRPGELSGGEQQRIAVARALANSPRIVFADEPTGNLDSQSGEQLRDLLWELNAVQKQTFVIVTHNDQFAKHSHRVFRMMDGKLEQV